MGISLYEHQKEALPKMKNGCILCGGVGSGKSRTALAYYFMLYGGTFSQDTYEPMSDPDNLYIITTARKRDSLEWEGELVPFLMGEPSIYSNKVIIDSWNNIKKYQDVENAFFIFDEQRVVGKGAWVKSFLKITKKNRWILLSATPGDTWADYIPVFIANGFYKNRTEFNREHIIFKPYTNYPVIDRYLNTGKLLRLRNQILVDMKFDRPTTAHHITAVCHYDHEMYRAAGKDYWDPFKNEPITNASSLCYVWRKITNMDETRQTMLLELMEKHPKIIVFYNFDYELDILTELAENGGIRYAQWNGHLHQPVPEGAEWLYFVQYSAGCEAWNCITTDTIVFYSQNYSYKVMEQASGRIDRLNTPYTDLYYYHFKSRSNIDLAIGRALKEKRKFNEQRFVNERE